MEDGIERRRHLRAPLDLPVRIKTSRGVIIGKTANISISGLALLLFVDAPNIGDEFKITLDMPEGHEIPVNCKKIWADNMVTDDAVYNAIGVQFTKILPSDCEIIASLVSEYYF